MGLNAMKSYQNMSNAIYGMCKDVLSRNYPYALSVKIPPDKDTQHCLTKIKDAYIRYEKPCQRLRARKRGEAVFRVISVPKERIALIAATNGEHPYFFKNPNLKDIRKHWVTFGGYKIKRVKKVRIAVTDEVYWATWQALKSHALRATTKELEELIEGLNWFKSSDTYRQKRMLKRHLNRQRKIHHLPLIGARRDDS